LTQLVPNEPAGWGNCLALRQRNFDVSVERLSAPDRWLRRTIRFNT
jgi:hypothetical protein